MKKSEELGRKTRKMIAKNLIVLAVLAVATVVGVRSWFTTNASADAAGINVKCSIPEGLEIAIKEPGQNPVSEDWKDQSFVITDTEYSFIAPLKMTDITGDGKTFINPPVYTADGAVALAETSVEWIPSSIATVPNRDYLSFDLYFRVKSSGKAVVLDQNTYYGPPTATNNFGNEVSGFSSDAVIGAARMSIYDSNLSNRKLLWIPAPHIFFDGSKVFVGRYKNDNDLLNADNSFGLFYISNNTEVYYNTPVEANNGTYKHSYYSYDNANQSKIRTTLTTANGVTANNTTDYKLGNDLSLCDLDVEEIVNNTSYYTNHVRVNFWVEGEDPESRAAQISGKFKAILCLKLADAS